MKRTMMVVVMLMVFLMAAGAFAITPYELTQRNRVVKTLNKLMDEEETVLEQIKALKGGLLEEEKKLAKVQAELQRINGLGDNYTEVLYGYTQFENSYTFYVDDPYSMYGE